MPDYHVHGYDRMTDADLLEKVTRGWKSSETPCGSGSTRVETRRIRKLLPAIAGKYGIKSVVDAGAGDLNWIPMVKWDVSYAGFDLYPRHPDVRQFDITKQVLPKAHLILCRHVLNHLSIQFSERALARFRESGSTYLLMTNCNMQEDYWSEYGLSAGVPIAKWQDTGKWRLELYHLCK